MNNTFFTQFKKETEKVRLSDTEREEMRAVLERAMTGAVKSPIQVTPSPLFFVSHRYVSAFSLVLIVAVLGSSTAYAAEGAVPGDLLYPIKIRINESVRDALAQSDEASAAWHAEAAERRLEEASTLAARGTLSSDVKEALEENFERHAARVEEVVSKLEAENPVAAGRIASRLGSSIEAHSAVIARLGDEGGEESRREARTLAIALEERGRRIGRAERATFAAEASMMQAMDTMAMKAEIAPAMAPAPSIDRDAELALQLGDTASSTLDAAEEALEVLEADLDATTSARTRAQIQRLRDLIRFLRETSDMSGHTKIEQALRDATKLKTFLEAQRKFRERKLLPVPNVAGEADVDANEKNKQILPIRLDL